MFLACVPSQYTSSEPKSAVAVAVAVVVVSPVLCISVAKPGPRTANVGDASGLVKIALNSINARQVLACVLLHRDDRTAVRVCLKYHLLTEMNAKLQ